MVGFYEERRSKAAIWCQRFAYFLVPYFVLVILLYRLGKIETTQVLTLIGIGLVFAILSLVFALRAITELWTRGYRGGSMVVRGTVITMLLLIPFGYHAYLALEHPLANDISTDTFDPPQYVTAHEVRAAQRQKGMNPVIDYSDEYADMIVLAYPKVQSRRYPAGPERVLEAVRAIITDNEWPVTGSLGVPELRSDEEPELADNATGQTQVDENIQTPDDIYIEALERSAIFGFENDVVIRIVSEDQNTLVDVRSSARWGQHDFGYNAKLIEKFLGQLDTALLGIAGEG